VSRAGCNDNPLTIGNGRLLHGSVELTPGNDTPGSQIERDHPAGHCPGHHGFTGNRYTGLDYCSGIVMPQGLTGTSRKRLHSTAAVPANNDTLSHSRTVPGITVKGLLPDNLSR
jgi:hypothetical protein